MEHFDDSKRHLQSIHVGPNYLTDDIQKIEVDLGEWFDKKPKEVLGYIFIRNERFYLYGEFDGDLYCAFDLDELNEVVQHVRECYSDFQKSEKDEYKKKRETDNLINDALSGDDKE